MLHILFIMYKWGGFFDRLTQIAHKLLVHSSPKIAACRSLLHALSKSAAWFFILIFLRCHVTVWIINNLADRRFPGFWKLSIFLDFFNFRFLSFSCSFGVDLLLHSALLRTALRIGLGWWVFLLDGTHIWELYLKCFVFISRNRWLMNLTHRLIFYHVFLAHFVICLLVYLSWFVPTCLK